MTNKEFRRRIITAKNKEYKRIMPADTVCPVVPLARYPVNIGIAFLTPMDINQQQIYRRIKLYFAFKRNINERKREQKI